LVVAILFSLALAGLGCSAKVSNGGSDAKSETAPSTARMATNMPDKEAETPPNAEPVAANMPDKKPETPAGALDVAPLPDHARQAKKDTAKSLIENGSFEQWVDKAPQGWKTSGSGVVRQAEDAHDGKAAVALIKAEEGKWSRLEYALENNKDLLGKALEVAVFAKASTPGMLALAIEYTQGGETKRFERIHPGNNEWQELKVRTEIPADANPDSLVFKVFRKQNKDGDAVVDSARARAAD